MAVLAGHCLASPSLLKITVTAVGTVPEEILEVFMGLAVVLLS